MPDEKHEHETIAERVEEIVEKAEEVVEHAEEVVEHAMHLQEEKEPEAPAAEEAPKEPE